MTEESKLRLADELLKLGGTGSPVADLINKLRAGYYDEFSDAEDASVAPELEIVNELRWLGLEPLARRVINGEFDASREDSDRWAERQTGETSRLIDALGIRGRSKK